VKSATAAYLTNFCIGHFLPFELLPAI